MFEGEPLHWFVRDAGSSYAHHLDYERPRLDRALCGHTFRDIVEEAGDRPRRVCRQCQARLPAHEAKWWQAKAETEARVHAETRRALTAARRKANQAARQRDELSQETANRKGSGTALQRDVAALQNELLQATAELGRRQSLIERYKLQLKGLNNALRKARAAPHPPATVQGPNRGGKNAGPRRASSTPRTGAKKRFHPVEGAPFPARVVRGGLPGLGKRR